MGLDQHFGNLRKILSSETMLPLSLPPDCFPSSSVFLFLIHLLFTTLHRHDCTRDARGKDSFLIYEIIATFIIGWPKLQITPCGTKSLRRVTVINYNYESLHEPVFFHQVNKYR